MEKFLRTASQLAQEAAQVVVELRQQPITESRKADKTLVTQADLSADRILREGLSKAFPDHAILTEEDGLSGVPGSDWVWLVDPLDGTKAYAKGIAGFSVMVGLLKEGRPYLGVVVDPMEGLVYEAMIGQGAWLLKEGKKTRLKVSDRRDLSIMPLVTSTGISSEILEKVKKILPGPLCEPINSVGIKVGLLVRQKADIYVNHHFAHYWDTCAPQVILEEAGGKFTRLDGKPLEYRLDSSYKHASLTLATNGTRHEELVNTLTSLLQDA